MMTSAVDVSIHAMSPLSNFGAAVAAGAAAVPAGAAAVAAAGAVAAGLSAALSCAYAVPTATANAIALLDVAEGLDPKAVEHTFDQYLFDWRRRRSGALEWTNYSPYEIRIIGALVRLGRREAALELLRFFLSDRRPPAWNQWPEIAWRDRRAPARRQRPGVESSLRAAATLAGRPRATG